MFVTKFLAVEFEALYTTVLILILPSVIGMNLNELVSNGPNLHVHIAHCFVQDIKVAFEISTSI